MRDFTIEEKELIINTEITRECFEMWDDYRCEQIGRHLFEKHCEAGNVIKDF